MKIWSKLLVFLFIPALFFSTFEITPNEANASTPSNPCPTISSEVTSHGLIIGDIGLANRGRGLCQAPCLTSLRWYLNTGNSGDSGSSWSQTRSNWANYVFNGCQNGSGGIPDSGDSPTTKKSSAYCLAKSRSFAKKLNKQNTVYYQSLLTFGTYVSSNFEPDELLLSEWTYGWLVNGRTVKTLDENTMVVPASYVGKRLQSRVTYKINGCSKRYYYLSRPSAIIAKDKQRDWTAPKLSAFHMTITPRPGADNLLSPYGKFSTGETLNLSRVASERLSVFYDSYAIFPVSPPNEKFTDNAWQTHAQVQINGRTVFAQNDLYGATVGGGCYEDSYVGSGRWTCYVAGTVVQTGDQLSWEVTITRPGYRTKSVLVGPVIINVP